MSTANDGFRHAPGCAHADWGTNGDGGENVESADEHDTLLKLSLGRSATGRHTEIYRCRECAAKGPLD